MSTDLFAGVQCRLVSHHFVHVEHGEYLGRFHFGKKIVQCFQQGVDLHLVGEQVHLDGRLHVAEIFHPTVGKPIVMERNAFLIVVHSF
jgi:hypothetical protein